jgi:hypothetical protein
MTMTVTLKLNDATYRRARRLADAQKQAVADVLADWITATLPTEETQPGQPAGDQGTVDVVDREMQAYIALHPQLKKQYLGRYVAIYGGRLVDHDDDYDEIFDRVDMAYPDEFVWLTQVENEPLKTLVFRSPRLESAAK